MFNPASRPFESTRFGLSAGSASESRPRGRVARQNPAKSARKILRFDMGLLMDFIPDQPTGNVSGFEFVHRFLHNQFRILSPRNLRKRRFFGCPRAPLVPPSVHRKGSSEPGRDAKAARTERYGEALRSLTGSGSFQEPDGQGRVYGSGSERTDFRGRSGPPRTYGKAVVGKGPSGPELLGWGALRRAEVQEGVRARPSGCNARTASEHLAPFPMAERLFPPETQRGPTAFAIRPRRQIMQTASFCTCKRRDIGCRR
jgi:hypothetical protein